MAEDHTRHITNFKTKNDFGLSTPLSPTRYDFIQDMKNVLLPNEWDSHKEYIQTIAILNNNINNFTMTIWLLVITQYGLY